MPMSVLIDKSHARNPNLLCFANGVADIGPSSYESGDGLDMYAFGPENVVTESLPYPYVAGASCPLWDAFLEEVMPDASMRDVMQEFFGLCYLDRSRMSVEKFAIFIGEGANGKSVIRDVVTAVMGRDNVAAYDAQQITQEKLQPFLNGKRINFASDMRSSASFDSALKALSSGQEVVGRRIYEDPVKVKCPPLVFSMNELPKFCDTTPAFFRRVLLFRFAVVIPEERRDSSLAAKICEGELPGVFNWILRGRDRLLSNRGVFTRCVAMDNEIAVIAADEKRRNDPVLRYLAARGLSVSPLYDGQKPVMVSQDEIVDALAPQLTRLSLTRTMTSFGVRMQRKSDGRYYWVYEIK